MINQVVCCVSSSSLLYIDLQAYNLTSSSAIAEGPRDALSQLKSCQLLYKCTKNHIRVEGLPFHVL